MRACFNRPLILQQLLSTRCLGHTNKRYVSNQLKDNYPLNMALLVYRGCVIFFFSFSFSESSFREASLVNGVNHMGHLSLLSWRKCSVSVPASIHADRNIHVIYSLMFTRIVWCHFLHLVPVVNAIMNRWANDMIPLLMNFPTGEEDSALPFCTSDF